MFFSSSTLLGAWLMAAAPASSASAPSSPSPADQTRDLFDEAATRYETSDYGGAVENYTDAYKLSSSIEDRELRGRVQAAILFNLARAHSKAYVLDKRAEHLRQQEDLLEKYLAQTADLADQLEAEILLDEARAELAYLEDEAREAEREAAREAEPAPVQSTPRELEVDGPPNKRGLKIAGYTLLGLGIGAGGAAITGAVLASQAKDEHIAGPTLSERNAATSKGDTANLLIIAGSASAGVLVTTGVAFIIAGRQRRSRNISSAPWATPTSAGLTLGGRF